MKRLVCAALLVWLEGCTNQHQAKPDLAAAIDAGVVDLSDAVDAHVGVDADVTDAALGDLAHADLALVEVDAGPEGAHGLLLFGGDGAPQSGSSELTPLGDTWIWDGAAWTQYLGAGPPVRSLATGARVGPDIILTTGLYNDTTLLADTWKWNGTAWAEVANTGISAREIAVAGALGNTLVVYGGYNTHGNDTSDTWTWNGSLWTLTLGSPSGPGPGVQPGGGTLGSLFYVLDPGNDVWSWDGTTWTDLHVAAPLPPGVGSPACATYGNRLILFGGSTDLDSTLIDQTWSFDGTSWTQVMTAHAPSPRVGAAMAEYNGKLVLHGGWDGTDGVSSDPTTLHGETWLFDGTDWTELNVSGPSARTAAFMAAR